MSRAFFRAGSILPQNHLTLAQDHDASSVWAGIVIGLLIPMVLLLGIGVRSFMVLIGAVQLVYIVPVTLIAWLNGWFGLIKGLAIAAALVALLNGACFGLVIAAFMGR